ncbi:MAG: bifunctional DNA-formamidopyrimidine glycosylase/DNA-(apurinic or apyrimidinic site) lyase [Acidobacteria bacterium]|nr:bifunctional DNA-formamidopyrimidine glycosylase/DNA-(apurinic or apyrimidinic site) lyase [Acidobacteriota bacterium]
MPELPEAETIVRSLRGHLEGARITRVEFRSARVSKSDPARLAGTTVAGVNRYGKQILWELDRGWVLVKLGMTGALLWNSEPGPYTRALVELTNGHVCFDDIRQFGSLSVMATPPNTLGPDPLEITSAAFAQRLRQRDTEVKKLLLDQKFVRGIGNIYADEALFRAGIHPKARTRQISAARARGLHLAAAELLRTAIEHRGSSISDYVDAGGERGSFQSLHLVYGKEGESCRTCGSAIRRIVVGQRGTHFCPRCQKRT